MERLGESLKTTSIAYLPGCRCSSDNLLNGDCWQNYSCEVLFLLVKEWNLFGKKVILINLITYKPKKCL